MLTIKRPEIQACITQIEDLISRHDDLRNLRKQGRFPRQVFSVIFQLLDHYFDDGQECNFSADLQNYPNLTRSIDDLVALLKTLPQEDVLYLYGVSLFLEPVEKSPTVFFAQFFLQCLHGDLSNIRNQMVGLALSLLKYDASRLSSSPFMLDSYSRKGVGPGFALKVFSSIVDRLLDDALEELVPKLKELSRLIKLHESACNMRGNLSWPSEIISLTREVFKDRWVLIKDKFEIQNQVQINGNSGPRFIKLDYTRHSTLSSIVDPNTLWVRTAQLLSGAKLIEPNYYRLLIPTLMHDDIPYLGPVIDVPLTDLLLSEDETTLISLEVSVKRCQVTKVFCNHSTDSPRPFSVVEKERIKYSAPHFYEYVKEYIDYNELPLSFVDLECLIRLVNQTLDPNGLEEKIDQEHICLAEQAYFTFGEELEKRAPIDAERLLQHRTRQVIRQVEVNRSIQDTLNNIYQANQDGCIASCGKYFAQTVLDYMPWFRFNERIENSFAVGTCLMREKTAKKVPKDYDFLTTDEAIHRNKLLMESLLTHKFDNSWFCSDTIEFEGRTNFVSKENHLIHAIFNYLRSSLKNNDPRYTYVHIIEGIVIPALIKGNSNLSESVLAWFHLIQNQKLFECPSAARMPLVGQVIPDLSKSCYSFYKGIPAVHSPAASCMQLT